MNADVKWFCMSALLRDWIWILTYLTEGVLVIASCNYMETEPQKTGRLTGFHQQNDTKHQCSQLESLKNISFSNYDSNSQVLAVKTTFTKELWQWRLVGNSDGHSASE